MSSVGRSTCFNTFLPSSLFKISIHNLAISSIGMLTVVCGAASNVGISRSSNPTTLTSSGTFTALSSY